MGLIDVLPKELERKLSVLAEELTALVRETRAELAAIKATRERLQQALRDG